MIGALLCLALAQAPAVDGGATADPAAAGSVATPAAGEGTAALAAATKPAVALSPGLEAEAHAIGMVLRCPVCQGMPIAESPSDMAQAMMARTRELLSEGKSRDEIIAYFTDRYGDWVLLAPRATGVNLLLWILPAVALLLGAVLVRRYGKGAAPRAAGAGSAAADAYVDAVRREVDE